MSCAGLVPAQFRPWLWRSVRGLGDLVADPLTLKAKGGVNQGHGKVGLRGCDLPVCGLVTGVACETSVSCVA